MTADVIAVPGIDQLPFAVALRESAWAYGAVLGVHLTGVALLLGPVLAFDLRVLGFARQVPVDRLGRLLLPVAVGALVLIVPSGLAMFAAHASELLTRRLFMLKMLLVFTAAVNAVVFHAGAYRGVARWRTDTRAPAAARAGALASMMLWAAVAACGLSLDPG